MTSGTLESARAGPGRAAAIAGALALAALAGLVYARTAATLWTTWQTNDNYSHGPLVPVVSAALVWMRRRELAALPVRPDARGLALVALACAMQVAGLRADVFALQGWSMVVLLFGVALTFLGGRLTRALAFPIGYLVFMLTFPPVVVLQLGYALKNVAVELSTRAASLLGVGFERHGMSLIFPSGELRVENPCSGLRSMIALLAMGALLGALTPGPVWRRVALFVASVPIAILANAVRLTLIIIVAERAGVPVAGGWVHDVSGYLVYALSLAGLLALRAPFVRERRAAAGERP